MINILFPPFCVHCKQRSSKLFCPSCASFFELIDPFTRCPFCFAENETRRPCPECVSKKRWQMQVASAVDCVGPVRTLVKKMNEGQMPYLAKTGAALMFMQLERLRWKCPDLIIPVPRRRHALLLAKHLAHYLKVDMRSYVKCRLGDFSTQEHRYLKRRARIQGKTILLVDDVITTGVALRHTAEALKDGFPKKIYALALASSP